MSIWRIPEKEMKMHAFVTKGYDGKKHTFRDSSVSMCGINSKHKLSEHLIEESAVIDAIEVRGKMYCQRCKKGLQAIVEVEAAMEPSSWMDDILKKRDFIMAVQLMRRNGREVVAIAPGVSLHNFLTEQERNEWPVKDVRTHAIEELIRILGIVQRMKARGLDGVNWSNSKPTWFFFQVQGQMWVIDPTVPKFSRFTAVDWKVALKDQSTMRKFLQSNFQLR